MKEYDERNRDLLVNINGELVHRDQAGVSPFDSTLFYSWMVPTLASWGDQNIENAGDEPGDREIICIVGLQGDAQIDGGDRLQDSNR